jgi:hypothetical protein
MYGSHISEISTSKFPLHSEIYHVCRYNIVVDVNEKGVKHNAYYFYWAKMKQVKQELCGCNLMCYAETDFFVFSGAEMAD